MNGGCEGVIVAYFKVLPLFVWRESEKKSQDTSALIRTGYLANAGQTLYRCANPLSKKLAAKYFR
jgi:hypothetical protein